jgi:small-conductance mechanosensitive channel
MDSPKVSKKSWWSQKSKKQKVSFVVEVSLWILAIASVVLLVFSKNIFGVDLLGNDEGTWSSIASWFSLHGGYVALHTILTLAIGLMAIALLGFLSKKIGKHNKKVATVYSLVRSFLKWLIILAMIFRILTVWGVDVGTALAGLGIVALVVGVGCQSLIADIVAGVFMVVDETYSVGDIVVIDDFRGTIKEIGLKSTKVEDAGGNLKIVDNSDIGTVVNLTDDLSLAVSEPHIRFDEDVARVEAVVAKNMDRIKKDIPSIVEGPYYKGISEVGDSDLVLKFIARCKEEDRFQVERDMNREFFLLWQENDISMPYPIYTIDKASQGEVTSASAKEVKTAEAFVKEQKELSHGLEKVNE